MNVVNDSSIHHLVQLATKLKLLISNIQNPLTIDIKELQLSLCQLTVTFVKYVENTNGTQYDLGNKDYQLVYQTCHLLFSKILPHLDHQAEMVDVETLTTIKISSCNLLSSLSIFNPDYMISCWPLFLTDTFAEEKNLESIYNRSVLYANSVVLLEDGFNDMWEPSSPLLRMFCCSIMEVRTAATSCLQSMMVQRPLTRWLRPSRRVGLATQGLSSRILRYLAKVLKIMIVVLTGKKYYGTDHSISGVLQLFFKINISLDTETIEFFPLVRTLCEHMLLVIARRSIGVNNGISLDKKGSTKKGDIVDQSSECLGWLCKTVQLTQHKFMVDYLSQLSFIFPSSSSLNGGVTERVYFVMWLFATYSMACEKKLKIQESLIYLCIEILCTFLSSSMYGNFPHSNMIQRLSRSTCSGERLLCIRAIQKIIRDNLTAGDTPMLLRILWGAIEDENHLVRIAVLEAIGDLHASHWSDHTVLHNGTFKLSSSISNRLLKLTEDEKGTVRAAACKSLGEIIGTMKKMDFEIHWFQALLQGCKDSKLTVRIQSMWSLAKVFEIQLLELSLRNIILINQCDWLQVLDICINALHDSEKIQTTAVRCMCLCLATGTPYFSEKVFNHLESAQNLTRALEVTLTKLFSESLCGNMSEVISAKPHKLLCAVADLLGCIIYIVLKFQITCNCVRSIKILLGIFRYSGLQSRIQALRTIIALIHCTNGLLLDSNDAQEFMDGVIFILENERGSLLKMNPSKSARVDPKQNLQRLRFNDLRRTLVEAFTAIILLQSMDANYKIQIISQHIDVVLSLLETAATDVIGKSISGCLVSTMRVHEIENTLQVEVNVIVECTNSILRLIQNNSLGSITIFRLQNLLTREDSYSNILTGEYRHFGENSSDLTMQIFSLESTSKKREDAMIEEDEI